MLQSILSSLEMSVANLFMKVSSLLILFGILLFIDIILFFVSVLLSKSWDIDKIRKYLLSKVGSIIAIGTGFIFDLVILAVQSNFPEVDFASGYVPIFGATLTFGFSVVKIGSIFKNLVNLHTPFPSWLLNRFSLPKEERNDNNADEDKG